MDNRLYCGDCLDVLRGHISDATADLIYLDPPFNSNAVYTMWRSAGDGRETAGMVPAFEDRWPWDAAAAQRFAETIEAGGRAADVLHAFERLIGPRKMLAYLAMMAPRLEELRRVLKPTGSLYLHCDPTASHYLKLLLDAVFGPEQFRNEIVWRRTGPHNRLSRFGRVHDVILYYVASDAALWNPVHIPYTREYTEKHYRFVEAGTGRRYRLCSATAHSGGQFEWRGRLPPPPRGWAYRRETLDRWEAEGRLVFSRNGVPAYKLYLDERRGQLLQDVWTDIGPLRSSTERVGYPTQKPEALLERIITSSSKAGDVVLDPFCGSGTAIVAAQKLGRRWIGIDAAPLAISVAEARLRARCGDTCSYTVIGAPPLAG